MMKRKIAVAAIALGLGRAAIADGDVTALIDFLQINADADNLLVKFEQAPNGQPSCATAARMIVELDSSTGPYLFGLLTSAQASGNEVRVVGTGTCLSTGANSYERLRYMRVLSP